MSKRDNNYRSNPIIYHIKLIAFYFVLICSYQLKAQNVDLKFEHLLSENGLSQSSVKSICQSKDGYLWIGTDDGLNKYDGYRFIKYRYDPNDSNTIQHNNIWTLYEDRAGALWVGTYGGGLGCIFTDNRGNQKIKWFKNNPDDSNSLSHNSVFSIYEDIRGILWIGTQDGLNKFDIEEGKFIHYKSDESDLGSLSNNWILSIFEDRYGELWIGTIRGLDKFNRNSNTFAHYKSDPSNPKSLSNRVVWSIGEDKFGNLWIGTVKGINKFDRKSETFTQYYNDPDDAQSISHNFIQSIFRDKKGRLWIGTRGGGLNQLIHRKATTPNKSIISFIKYQTDKFNPTSLSDDHVFSIHEDQSGVLWIGTTRGLNKVQRKQEQFVHIKNHPQNSNSLSENNILSLCEDQFGIIWIGTKGGGLNQLNKDLNGNFQFKLYKHRSTDPYSISNNSIYSLYAEGRQISSETLWIGTKEDINQLSYKNHKSKLKFKQIVNSKVTPFYTSCILKDSQGRYWFGSIDGGLFQSDSNSIRKQKLINFRHKPQEEFSISDNCINSIYEDSQNRLWIGTKNGLNRFIQESSEFISYFHDSQNKESLCHNTIICIYEDHTGLLWVGTEGGLSQVMINADNEVKFINYTEKNGLPSQVIHGILEDDRSNIWLSTNNGLSKFTPIRGDSTKKPQFRNYDVDDGLQSNEFNFNAYCKGDNGEMYFGGINGITYFHPDSIKDNLHIPPVVITAFKIFDKLVFKDRDMSEIDRLNLSYKENFFSFEFAALDYNAPQKNQYAYKLEGFDKDWVYCGNRRYASYTNLDGGNYVFRVKGSNSDGIWNEEGASLRIKVIPPPWKTIWAYCLYIIAIIGLIYGYVRYKTKTQEKEIERQREVVEELKKVDKLKDEFMANTSHELRTPLNGIIGLAESLIDGAGGDVNAVQQQNLSMIVNSGKRLAYLVNDILDFSKLRSQDIVLQNNIVDMSHLTDSVFALSRPLLSGKRLKLINSIPHNVPKVSGDENRLRQIMHNLIGNAIKFTDSGQVKVTAEQKENMLQISVTDTGIGIPKEYFKDIFKSFEQVDASTEREYGGTGLGLSITKQLVELHQGQIWVESELRKGSCFCFTLPISSEQDMVQDIQETQIQVSDNLDFNPIEESPVDEPIDLHWQKLQDVVGGSGDYKILVVDDEPVNQQVLKNYLSLENYSVHQSLNGIEALKAINQGLNPDLIVLDIMMPKMSGYDVCRTLREEKSLSDLPILMLTAKNQLDDLIHGFEAGANDYIGKPFDKRELLARVRTLITLKQAMASHDNLVALQQELDIARKIQLSILPQNLPEVPGLDIQARYLPMESVGGDFYDFHCNGESNLGILVADVSGHGVPAALIGSMVKILFSMQKGFADKPGLVLENMNSALHGNCGNQFITSSYTYFDIENRSLHHGDAGHLPMFIIKRPEKNLNEFKPKGMAMGWIKDITCPAIQVNLEPGDRVILYSDGIIEGRNEKGEFYEERFMKLIAEKSDFNAKEFADYIIQDLAEWSKNEEGYDDDVMMLVVDVLF